MVARRFRHKQDSNQNQKGQRQNLQGRVLFNHLRNWPAKLQHNKHGDHNSRNHDGQVLGHADSGQNAVKTEYDIQQGNLHNNGRKGGLDLHILAVLCPTHFDDFIDLAGGFLDQEKATQKEHRIPTIDAIPHDVDEGLPQPNDPRDRKQHHDSENQRQSYTERARLGSNILRQFVRQNADKNDVVNPQDNLQKRERQEGEEGFEGEEVQGWKGERVEGLRG